jgi:hypothetical protein
VNAPLQAQDLQELALRLSAVVDFLEERTELASEQARRGASALDQAALAFGGTLRQFPEAAIMALASQAQEAVRSAVVPPVSASVQRLEQAIQGAQRASLALEDRANASARATSSLAWKAGIALLVGSLLAAGGSSLIAWKSLRDLQRAGFGEDILQATRSGAITHCDEALCVKVGADPRRAGASGEFLLVEP